MSNGFRVQIVNRAEAGCDIFAALKFCAVRDISACHGGAQAAWTETPVPPRRLESVAPQTDSASNTIVLVNSFSAARCASALVCSSPVRRAGEHEDAAVRTPLLRAWVQSKRRSVAELAGAGLLRTQLANVIVFPSPQSEIL